MKNAIIFDRYASYVTEVMFGLKHKIDTGLNADACDVSIKHIIEISQLVIATQEILKLYQTNEDFSHLTVQQELELIKLFVSITYDITLDIEYISALDKVHIDKADYVIYNNVTPKIKDIVREISYLFDISIKCSSKDK